MEDHNKVIMDVVHRAPDWLRRDLMSDDRNARAVAEEALSAMIASALTAKKTEL